MARPRGTYRLIDAKTNSLIVQGSKKDIAEKLNVNMSYIKNLITRGSLAHKIYIVCDLYKYKGEIGTVQEIADKLGVSFHHVLYRKKLVGAGIRERGYRADKNIYALYEGENLKTIGTAAEIVDSGITTPSGFYNFLYKAAETTGDTAKCVVMIEE